LENSEYRKEVTLNLFGFVRKNLIPSEGYQSFGVSLQPEHSTEFMPKSQAEGKNQHSGWGVEKLTLFSRPSFPPPYQVRDKLQRESSSETLDSGSSPE